MLLDVFLLRQDYEHVNTVFKPWCGMITFLYRLSNGPSLIPGTSVTAYYLSNGLKKIPGLLLFIQRLCCLFESNSPLIVSLLLLLQE